MPPPPLSLRSTLHQLRGPYRDGPASGENRSHLCRQCPDQPLTLRSVLVLSPLPPLLSLAGLFPWQGYLADEKHLGGNKAFLRSEFFCFLSQSTEKLTDDSPPPPQNEAGTFLGSKNSSTISGGKGFPSGATSENALRCKPRPNQLFDQMSKLGSAFEIVS